MRTVTCEEKIRLYTQRCLALAINEAMIAAEGEDWFAALAANEDTVRKKNSTFAVLKEGHTRIAQCDFQAVLKILFYRKPYREKTFPELSQKEKDKVSNTLSNIIDFRNSQIAHKAVLEEKDFTPGEYSYDNAILDMLYLLHFFPTIHGPAPKSEDECDIETKYICYYDEATKVFGQYKLEGGQRDFLMADVIKKYKLKISIDDFCKVCDQLNIVRFYPKETGAWYFCSADVKKDVSAIKECVRSKKTGKQRIKIPYIVTAVIVVLLVTLFTSISSAIKGIKNIFNLGDANKKEQTKAMIQDEIDNFVSTFGNTYNLSIGENHKPQASVWLQGNNKDICYSTNEDVVTVTVGGIAKAIAEGEAYVVIGYGNMFEVYKYIVTK